MNANDAVTYAGDLLVLLTTFVFAGSAVAYQLTTGGAWRKSEEGRLVMSSILAITSVLMLWLFRVVARDIFGNDDTYLWFDILRLIDFCLLPVVGSWQFYLIVTARARAKRAIMQERRRHRRQASSEQGE